MNAFPSKLFLYLYLPQIKKKNICNILISFIHYFIFIYFFILYETCLN